MTTANSSRIDSIDALRGFALLGILIMNIQSFAFPDAVYLNPFALDVLTPPTNNANEWAYIATHLFADQKFMTIFSTLFGVSMMLIIQSHKDRPLAFLCRRNGILFIFGLIHAYGIWHGDILVTYAICSFIVVWMRNFSATTLVILGAIFFLVPVELTFFSALTLPYWSPEDIAAIQSIWQPSAESLKLHIESFRGTWIEHLPIRIEGALSMQLYLLFSENIWRVCGLMLWGMASFKAGLFLCAPQQTQLLTRIPKAKIGIILLLFGLSLVSLGIYQNYHHNWQAEYTLITGSIFNYIGSAIVSAAYILLFLSTYRILARLFLMRWLRTIGKTALSNYLLQSILGTFIFYGYGLGLYAQVERWQLFLFLPFIWAIQIIISILWVKKFQYGPVEWLWRSLVDGKWINIRHQQQLRS